MVIITKGIIEENYNVICSAVTEGKCNCNHCAHGKKHRYGNGCDLLKCDQTKRTVCCSEDC